MSEILLTKQASPGSPTSSQTFWYTDANGNPAYVNSDGIAHSFAAVPAVVNAQSGTTYTLALADIGSIVTMSNASANTLTIPPNSGVALPVGTTVTIIQGGAGQTTIAPGAGVTLTSAASLTARAQWSMLTAVQISANNWVLAGDMT
jgi:hypothetical protein